MKTLAAILALALASCAGMQLSLETPYGSVTSDKEGRATVILKPIIIEK